MDEFKRPVTQHVDSLEIPLRVLDVDNEFKWELEVEKELAIRFNTQKGPLLRVVVIQKPNDTVLILVANHALADGSSLNYLFRDILSAVTGQNWKHWLRKSQTTKHWGFLMILPLQIPRI